MNHGDIKSLKGGNIYCYRLRGKPIAIAKAIRPTTRYCGDDGKIQRISHKIDLENQHEGRPLFTGPINLSITFHIVPTGRTRGRGTTLKGTPSIVSMVRFVEEMLVGIVCAQQDCIVRINADKVIDSENYTQIILEKI